MRTVILVLILAVVAGCSSLSGPNETQTIELEPSGGYGGEPVGSCSMRSADEICRSLGCDGATDYSCSSVHVTGGFFGSFDQDVMYTVTCYRD
jgi:hypothetical protein